jgi:hypothetical protein
MRLNIDLLVVLPLAVPPASVPIECLNLGVQSSSFVILVAIFFVAWVNAGRVGEEHARRGRTTAGEFRT